MTRSSRLLAWYAAAVWTIVQPSSLRLWHSVPALGWRAKRTWATVVVSFLAALPSIDTSAAEVTGARIALVVGNGTYEGGLGALRNPVNDARLMAETLRGVGFAVRLVEDADEQALEDAVVAFGGDLRRSGNGGVALFYYAGHGVQASGANYLIPVDAQVDSERHLKTRTVPATLVLEEMEDAPTALNIVVLDACRNNPYAASGRNVGRSRGLARMDTPSGSFFLAYSAAAGQVADDGDGMNSVYTGALAAAMAQPGLELEEVFKQAGRTVRTQTGGSQVPWREGSWDGAFHFVPPPSPRPVPRPQPPAGTGMDPEEEEWRFVRDSGDTRTVRSFLERHPNGRFSGAAQALLAQLGATPPTVQTQPAEEPVSPPPLAPTPSPTVAAEIRDVRAALEDALDAAAQLASPDCPACQPFTVRTGPPDARVQIMNIVPRYEPAIKLPPGDYDVRVTADGFETVERTLPHGDEPTDIWIGLPFQDCPVCPKMVELPTGSYTMGTGRGRERYADEGPAHDVEIRYPFAVGVFEVSFEEWDACAKDGGCARHFQDDGVGQQPVVQITVADTKEYVHWLEVRTGRPYRLLSEAEWEYAARAGTSWERHWGSKREDQCAHENGADVTAQAEYSGGEFVGCIDGYVYTAPNDETRFRPNPWGLYHMLGNVSEWTADCYHPNYVRAPTDGSAWTQGCDPVRHVARGGSWASQPRWVRAPMRSSRDPAERSPDIGFRVAVEIVR